MSTELDLSTGTLDVDDYSTGIHKDYCVFLIDCDLYELKAMAIDNGNFDIKDCLDNVVWEAMSMTTKILKNNTYRVSIDSYPREFKIDIEYVKIIVDLAKKFETTIDYIIVLLIQIGFDDFILQAEQAAERVFKRIRYEGEKKPTTDFSHLKPI